jgi:KDO2-lipid IV(A) lauroyltransferase
MAKKGKLLTWVEYIPVRLTLEFLSLLPRKAAVAVGIGIARLGFHLIGNLRRTGLRNLQIAFPEMAPAERLRILKASFDNLGRVLGDVSHFSRITPKEIEQLVDVGGAEAHEIWQTYDRRQTDGKRGILVTTAHLGNWEMLVLSFAALREPMSYLARPLDNPLIEEMTYKIRTRFGNRPINKTNSARPALRILKAGGILGALVDVNWTAKGGVFVPLFGVPACTTTGPAILALQSGALMVSVVCVWDKAIERYRYVWGNIIEPVQVSYREDSIRQTTALFTAEIERMIRQYPEQWMWIHKRWKTRPEGENSFYSR